MIALGWNWGLGGIGEGKGVEKLPVIVNGSMCAFSNFIFHFSFSGLGGPGGNNKVVPPDPLLPQSLLLSHV